MKKLVIVVYDISVLGGAERVTTSVANELSNYYEIVILSLMGDRVNDVYKLKKEIRVEFLGIKPSQLRTQIISCFDPLKKFLKKQRADVVLLEGNYCGLLCSSVRLFCKTKFVFCDHGSFLSQYNEKRIRYSRRIATLLCDHTVVLTERSRDDYIKYFHLNEKKITCIYNWIDESAIDFHRAYNSASKSIISVGRFGREKGYDLLVQVAKKVMPNHRDWRWLIYGNGETFEEIKEAVKKEGIDDLVVLMGETKNIREAYENASFLVLPSYREGMPLALLEGKCYKLPLVSFDIISGPKEIILDRVNGFLIEPYNVDSMAERIEDLIRCPDLRISMADHAYDNIESFRMGSIVRSWRKLIEETLG